jgi:O-antigen/teichoic acid export membrane protein
MSYKKNVISLITGSAAAQAIPILISPLLTRLYSPKEFGLLALYLSISAVLSVFAAGRYDLALIEPAQDSEARGLLFAGLWLSVVFSLCLSIVLALTAPYVVQLIGSPDGIMWLNLVPITVLSMSCLSLFTYWLNRCKNFKAMNTFRIFNSVCIAGLSIFFAFTQFKPEGLMFGYMLGQMLTVVFIWFAYLKPEKSNNRVKALIVMREYFRYPKFLIPSTLAGTIASESPIVLLTRLFDTTVSGLFSFVNRVTVSPMTIIGNSIGEVYRVRAAENFQKHGECRQIFLHHVRLLAIAGIVPWLALFFWGPRLFTFVFGPQWSEAGEMATILSFVVWFQLVSTPLSYTITFNHSQHLDLYLQIFRVAGSVGSVCVGYAHQDYMLAVQLYSVTYCLYYFFHSVIQYRAAKGVF